MMEVLAGFVAIVAAFLFARWTLGPLERASAHSKAPVQIAIADILCLFVPIQVLLAIYQWAWKMNLGNSEVLWGVVFLLVVVVAIWFGSVALLARAGVRNAWHRAFVLIIGIPLGVLGSLAVSLIPAVLICNAAEGRWGLFWLAPLALLVLGLLGGIRLAIGRIVAAAQQRSEE